MGGVVILGLGKASLAPVHEGGGGETCVGSRHPQTPSFTGGTWNPQGRLPCILCQVQERDLVSFFFFSLLLHLDTDMVKQLFETKTP